METSIICRNSIATKKIMVIHRKLNNPKKKVTKKE